MNNKEIMISIVLELHTASQAGIASYKESCIDSIYTIIWHCICLFNILYTEHTIENTQSSSSF